MRRLFLNLKLLVHPKDVGNRHCEFFMRMTYPTNYLMKKALGGDANTARWLYKGRAKHIRPAANSLPGGAGRLKLNQLEMSTIPLPTNPVW